MAAPNRLIQNSNNLNTNQTVNSTTIVNSPSNILDALFQQGKIDSAQLNQIKFEAINTGKSLESLAIERGLISGLDIIKIKAQQFNVPFVDISSIDIPTEVLQKIPQDVARNNLAIAFGVENDVYKVAMADPLDLQRVKFVQAIIGKVIIPHFAAEADLKTIIDTRYGAQVGNEVAEALEEVGSVVDIRTTANTEETAQDISNAPVSKIVNMILEYAAKFKASDIHVEPKEDKLSVRYRINGVLSEKLTLPKKLIPSIVSRIKIMSDLKIDEHRIPQDGRFQIKVDDQAIDMRVSIVPTVHGEKVVMRLLERGGGAIPLEKTGLRGIAYKIFIEAIRKTQGIILITGPTGSGKTQTLASALNILNKADVNIMTLEDPVEIRINGVNQVQINPEVGLTFAKGLRAFLRQDPNIIMVGEIRDGETADLAIQASLTGHLVLATLHTNSAAGALPRLFDMEIPPYLLASTINVVVGQRLIRKICDHCKEMYYPTPEVADQVHRVIGGIQGYDMLAVAGDPTKLELFRGKGCPQCNNTGYAGRLGIFEVMNVSENIGRLVMGKKSSTDIQQKALEEGMITMLQDGFMKAVEGITTVEEVLRVQN